MISGVVGLISAVDATQRTTFSLGHDSSSETVTGLSGAETAVIVVAVVVSMAVTIGLWLRGREAPGRHGIGRVAMSPATTSLSSESAIAVSSASAVARAARAASMSPAPPASGPPAEAAPRCR
jgi:hypothetical protein